MQQAAFATGPHRLDWPEGSRNDRYREERSPFLPPASRFSFGLIALPPKFSSLLLEDFVAEPKYLCDDGILGHRREQANLVTIDPADHNDRRARFLLDAIDLRANRVVRPAGNLADENAHVADFRRGRQQLIEGAG